MVALYLLLAYSLNLIMGFGDLLSLAHAAFFGFGAYTAALLLTKWSVSAPVALLASLAVPAALAGLIGVPSLRFRGDPFVIVTIAFQTISTTVLNNWVSLTNGPYGISDIPRPGIGSAVLNSTASFALLCAVIAAAGIGVLFLVYRSPYGLALKAIRDDERAARALGKPPFTYLLRAFVLAGAVAGLAGYLYASYITYIDPSSFTLAESVFIVSVLLVGGMGSRAGPLVGTVVLVSLPEVLRFMGLPVAVAANIRQMLLGVLIVLIAIYRPRGLIGEHALK